MCVIIVGAESRPSLGTLKAAEERNGDGGGMAWVTPNGMVRYLKGITAKRVHNELKKLPKGTPFVCHFRITTLGGTCPELTHPFPATSEVETDLDGEAERVLFHNGTWSAWRDRCLSDTTKWGVRPPDGTMSDSRAVAWMVYLYGPGVLNLIQGQKFALVDSNGVRIWPADEAGWSERDGCMYSNLNHERKIVKASPSLYSRSGSYLGHSSNDKLLAPDGSPLAPGKVLANGGCNLDELRTRLTRLNYKEGPPGVFRPDERKPTRKRRRRRGVKRDEPAEDPVGSEDEWELWRQSMSAQGGAD